MKDYHISRHSSFYTIGLNYKKADAVLRGKFSLEETAMNALLEDA
jgi:glutamyl-tRNA reductase